MDDKRRFPRFAAEGVTGQMGLRAQVQLLDLGLGGAAVRTQRRLNVGDEYALKFELPGESVTLNGVVVWSVPSGTAAEGAVAEHTAGIKFTRVLAGNLGVVHRYIEQQKPSDERRVMGIRVRFSVPAQGVLECLSVYKIRLISMSGMLIETERRLDRDDVHEMEILPPGAEPIAFSGRVRSCLEIPASTPTRHEIGIEFLQMSREDRTRLNRFMESTRFSAPPRRD